MANEFEYLNDAKVADVPEDEYGKILDGKYEAYVYEIMTDVTKKGAKCLKLTLKILDEQYKNRNVWYYALIPDISDKGTEDFEKKLNKIKKVAKILDDTVENVGEFLSGVKFADYLDTKLKITLKSYKNKDTNEDNQSVYINENIGKVDKQEVAASNAVAASVKSNELEYDPFAED